MQGRSLISGNSHPSRTVRDGGDALSNSGTKLPEGKGESILPNVAQVPLTSNNGIYRLERQ